MAMMNMKMKTKAKIKVWTILLVRGMIMKAEALMP